MSISFGKNEGFLLREEFVCKAIPAAASPIKGRRSEGLEEELPGRRRVWRIDEALLATEVDSIPNGVVPTAIKEQFIDTLMLRNADQIIGSLIGQPVTFLFHSHDYWGELDLCFVAQDGTALLIENKSGRPSGASRKKFRDDVESITSALANNLQHRFTHVIKYLDRYHALAKRAFAACFLGVRCDVEKESRDLWTEAASQLGISSEELEARFQRGNKWLDRLRATDTFPAYLKAQGIQTLRNEALPILTATRLTQADLPKWSNESSDRLNRQALALEFQVFGTAGEASQFVTVQSIGQFEL